MSIEAVLLLIFLGLALASFVFELLPVDVTALTLLFGLIVTGIVPLDAALTGFSNKGVLTIAGLFVLSHALVRTGLFEVVAERLSGRWGKRPWVAIGVLLALVALMSGFLNNTAVVAMTIPLAMELCRRLKINPSRVLMPLSFAAIFGGTLTLIGTSTNLLVSSLVEQSGGEALGMFEFSPMGLVFLGAGLLYVLLLAPRALPERVAMKSLTSEFDLGDYLTELKVTADSKILGKTVKELRLSERYDVTVLAVLRGSRRISSNLRAVAFREGDLLLVRGGTPGLVRLRNETGVALVTDVTLSDEEIAGGEQVVIEAFISPNSSLLGRTLVETDFRRRYGAFVLAIRRAEATLRERLARTRLQFADTLLIVAPQDRLADLRSSGDLVLAGELDFQLRRERLWWLPLVLIPAIILLAAGGTTDLLVGVLGAIVLLMALGVIRPQESYRAVEWRVVVFIAAFIPVGEAMFRTGLADALAAAALLPGTLLPERLAPWVAVSVLYLVTSISTETVTNNAAAVVLTPVALTMATQLGIDSRPLIFAVCFAASASFLTPTGYQTNMMVYGAGSYRFSDFTKFGGALNLLFWIIASFLIPLLFPFG